MATDFAQLSRLAYAYSIALEAVTSGGYSDEAEYQRRISIDQFTPASFLQEFAWVVLNSGMRERTIRNLFPRIKAAFRDFDPRAVAESADICAIDAITTFNHPGKIAAIVTVARRIDRDFGGLLESIKDSPLATLQTFPFLGPATSRHFAKNLGVIDTAKPDRHLLRIAAALGFDDAMQMCADLGTALGEKAGVIDVVFWRWCTIDPNYLDALTPPP